MLFSLVMKDETTGKDNLNSGTLRLSLMFAPGEKGKGTLHINIKQAKELPKMDPNGLTDGLVKCHLLPDKSAKGKRKTGVIKNNLNPVWEERFIYEKVTLEELSKERVLEVTVWDHDSKGSNDFIGGVRLGSAPSTASKHKEWMDSIGDEVSHWEAMLTHPGEWVDRWHTLRHSMDPRSVDLTSLQAAPQQRQQRQSSPSVERRGADHPSTRAHLQPVPAVSQPPSQTLLPAQPPPSEERVAQGQSPTTQQAEGHQHEDNVSNSTTKPAAVVLPTAPQPAGPEATAQLHVDSEVAMVQEPAVESTVAVEGVNDEMVEVRERMCVMGVGHW